MKLVHLPHFNNKHVVNFISIYIYFKSYDVKEEAGWMNK